MTLCTIQAQVLEQGEPALVYFSPKTGINLHFVYTMDVQERGIFAEYAQSMLGATEVVTETSTVCTLQEVRISTFTGVDYSRPHKVSALSGIPMYLTINEKGLLRGYNAVPEQKEVQPNASKRPDLHAPKCEHPIQGVAPYTEDVLKAANEEAQAFEAAKQILHIRETRMYLLSGEMENAPADGKAMERVLAELDKQERELTELFVGKHTHRRMEKRLQCEPGEEGALFFFSDENGFTDADNVDADTIEVRMVCTHQTAAPLPEGSKKKAPELSPIVYNLPGQCAISVIYKGRSLNERTVQVAQFGLDVALPKAMFTGKELPKILFSEKTGNIVSISK